MELKREETVTRETGESRYSDLSSSVNSEFDYEEPYRISVVTNAKTKDDSVIVKYVVIAMAIVVFLVSFYAVYKRNNRYNGKYELTEISSYGITITVDQMNSFMGISMYESITIKGSHCRMLAYYNGQQQDGSADIEFDGSRVTITDAYSTFSGTYNATEKTITFEKDGVEVVFKKTDE